MVEEGVVDEGQDRGGFWEPHKAAAPRTPFLRMRDALCISLPACTPQTYKGILLTVTSFQHFFLETLACYDYITYWRDLQLNPINEPQGVTLVVGTLTVEVELAIQFYDKGIPVWLVRRPCDFPLSTTIANVIYPTLEPMEFEFLPGSVALWSGPARAFRNRVCQSLRSANIRLSHSAYQAPAGPFLPVNNQSWYFIVRGLYQTHVSSLADVVLGPETLPGAQVPSRLLPEPMDTAPIQTAPSGPSSLHVTSTRSAASSHSHSYQCCLPTPSSSGSSRPFPLAAPSSSSRSPSNERRLPTPSLPGSLRPFPSNFVIGPSAAPSSMLQISKDKFETPRGQFVPMVNRVWMVALEKVMLDRTRVCDHPDMMLFREYALPDLHLFLRSGRSALYMICWLMIKPLWLNMATSHNGEDEKCSPYPEPQDWRAFLTDLWGKMGLEVGASSLQPQKNASESKEAEESRCK